LCPIDFSDASRSALWYAAAVADHFGAHLTVLSVDDPILAAAIGAAGFTPPLASETLSELRKYCGDVFAHRGPTAATVDYRVATGKPAVEILRAARDLHTDLIVISSHGRSGIRKMFLGSTTERVLREAPVPVLITSGEPPPAASLSEIGRHVHRVLAPVDLTPVSRQQIALAYGISEALSTALIVAHVVEPVFVPASVRDALRSAEDVRRAQAHDTLSALVAGMAPKAEVIVSIGDASEQIANLAAARGAQLIVMGLHSSGAFGPRMGSVTYRVLCLSRALVLAIPPAVVHSRTTAGITPPLDMGEQRDDVTRARSHGAAQR
jgi:nucleotide-binding universal stress UspA family protein